MARQRKSTKRNDQPLGVIEGVLDLSEHGAGFLRDPRRGFAARGSDPYVSPDAVRKFGLRGGETIAGPVVAVRKGNRS